MKKALLLSVFVLNLAFGMPYEQEATECAMGNQTSCQKLINLCYAKSDCEACGVLATVTFTRGVFLNRHGDTQGAKRHYDAAIEVSKYCCYEFKHQVCCNLLQNIE